MSKKVILGIAAVVIIGISVIVLPKFGVFLAGRKTSVNSKNINFVFKSKDGLKGLTDQLYALKIIQDKTSFMKVGDYKNLDDKSLATGMYVIEPGTSYRTLLNGFTLNNAGNGNAEQEVEVTFNNCRDVYDLAGKVSKLLMLDSTELINFVHAPSFLKELKLTEETVPALFFPNTYRMFYDTGAKSFVQRMKAQYTAFWTPLRMQQLNEIGMKNPFEAVTLASIVYSEQSKNSSEWKTIAGLYLNRLKEGMKLQSDPTFKFCWGDALKGVQRLTFEHRERDCPYNTYKYEGLPPGPICIPPTEVVESVLNPAKNDYIFMCAQPNYLGLHDFAVDYKTHKKNASKFQKWISNQ
jgi:UPF0755 protein